MTNRLNEWLKARPVAGALVFFVVFAAGGFAWTAVRSGSPPAAVLADPGFWFVILAVGAPAVAGYLYSARRNA